MTTFEPVRSVHACDRCGEEAPSDRKICQVCGGTVERVHPALVASADLIDAEMRLAVVCAALDDLPSDWRDGGSPIAPLEALEAITAAVKGFGAQP